MKPTEHTDTERQIFSMLTQNTGVHFLDSGGQHGRMWQRNQAAVAGAEDPLALWKTREEIIVDKWGCVYLDLFHYLCKRVEFSPAMQRRLYRWDQWTDPKHGEPWDEQITGWLDRLVKRGWAKRGETGYTYNFENLLSQNIVYYEFEIDGGPMPEGRYAIIQIHNGADARGGFTYPAIFEVDEMFLYDCQDYSCWCPNNYEPRCPGQLRLDGTEDHTKKCDFAFDAMGGDTVDRNGSFITSAELGFGDDATICPKCGATLEYAAPEPS